MQFTKEFSSISKADSKIAGGKGASLGEMTNAGIPVPPGYVILASAFERFIEEADLMVEIDSALHLVNSKEVHTVEGASERIHSLILSADMPKDIADEIRKAFKKLKAEFVAVRSSATAEDSSTAAWAGQLESYLNTTEKTLLENVKRCWASLFTPRAIVYRHEKNLHKHKISVAVVVQKMIESEVSGVAFSVHPVTQDRNQLIIEAGFGLGEAVVSGQITPDSYVVEKKGWQLIETRVNKQKRELLRSGMSGNEWVDVSAERANRQKLSDKDVFHLAKLVADIERHYRFPVDVEWAMKGGKFYIVQSRPITTLLKNTGIVSPVKPFKKSEKTDVPLSSDYIRLFEGASMPFLISDLFITSYKELYGLCIFKDNVWTSYIPSKVSNKTLEDGVALFGDKKLFDRYSKDFEDYKKRARALFSKLIKQQSISSAEAKLFLETCSEVWNHYRKTEFFYVDDAFRASKGNNTILNNLKQMEHIKNSGRAFMNKMGLVPGNFLTRFISHLAKQFNVRPENLFMYSINDILALWNGIRVNPDISRMRRQTYVMHVDREKEVNIYQGAEADDFVNRFSVSNPGVGLLKGTPANDGKVTGMVKVIPYNYDFKQTAKEVKTMKQGDILIAETTSPELMLACKKSIAIVTNQGGLLSHAAIVSREMGIPCIVGAQNATKLLKDGDLVEVDADKGVIRILNAMENIPLEKLYTRERSLFLNYIEHMSTFDQGKTIFGMKNFVYINKDGLTTYWYGLDEIKRLGGAFIQKSSDPTFLKETIAGFSSNWSKVSEYVAGKRKVHSFSELKLLSEDYSAYLNYMKIIYNATEMKGLLPDDFVKKSVSLRVSTQAFVETMDSILKTLIKEKSPRHHEYVDYMLPDEIFSLDQGDLSAKRLAEIKRRKEHGYVIFAGKVHSPYKLEAVLDRNGLRLSVMPKWFKILKRKRTPLINSFILDGLVRYYNKSIDIDYSFKNFAFIYDTWYGDADDFKRLKENILRQYADNPRYLRDLMDVAYDGADELDCFCKKIQKRDLRKRSNAQLSALFEEYSKRILDLVPYIQIAMAEEMIVTERIQAILNARIKDAKVVQDEFLLLASPIRKGYFEQENENLINLAIRIRNSPASLNSIKKGKADKLADKLIEGHLAEFSWIANMEYDGKLWAKGDILPRLQELVGKDAKAILKMSHDAERTKDAQLKTTLKSLKLSRSERALVDVMRELVFFRTYRTDVLFRSYYYVKGLFSEVSKRLGLADEDLFYLFYDEIPRSLAAGRADKKTISERKSGYVLYSLYGETRFDENKELIKSLHELDRAQATGADEIKGAIAFKGKVTGVVKLVMRTEDARKVNDGDILVSSMTKPDYIVAMQKAVGFVTDEGGITCHAAIISREMRKPCIIGTKIATQVLKDGDLIEVDADKGIVKVVKRK